MKHLKDLLAALAFFSCIIFVSCGGDDGGSKDLDPAVEQANKLIGDWALTAATLDGTAADGWDGFTLTFSGDETGGNYSASGAASEEVWPSSGTWEFDGDDIGTVLRSDGVEMDVQVSETLTLSFTIASGSGARASGIDGDWTFTFDAQ